MEGGRCANYYGDVFVGYVLVCVVLFGGVGPVDECVL